MIISLKQLKKVTVVTQGGQFLGYIRDFGLETDTGIIEKYYVRTKKLIPGLFEDSLIINKSQVISFDEDNMVVDDAVVKFKSGAINKIAEVNKLESTEPVVTEEM